MAHFSMKAMRHPAQFRLKMNTMDLPGGASDILHLNLASLGNVCAFRAAFRAQGTKLDAMVCNAVIYLPQAKEPFRAPDEYGLARLGGRRSSLRRLDRTYGPFSLEFPILHTLTLLALVALLTASPCETMQGAGREITTSVQTVTSEAQRATN